MMKLMKASEPAMALYEKGRSSLSDYQIISSIGAISIDKAREILTKAENIDNLATWGINHFMEFGGIGINKAAALVSAFELGRRRLYGNRGTKVKINSSQTAYDCLRPYLLDQEVEHFYCLFLNRANLVIKTELISTGTRSATLADPVIIFKKAFSFNTHAMILGHNHPSGNTKPSNHDMTLTERMVKAGRLLETPVLDHIVFTNEGYLSFADEGMI